eukprot:893141-Pelagomonas_calceolata.AAC.5
MMSNSSGKMLSIGASHTGAGINQCILASRLDPLHSSLAGELIHTPLIYLAGEAHKLTVGRTSAVLCPRRDLRTGRPAGVPHPGLLCLWDAPCVGASKRFEGALVHRQRLVAG